MQFDGGCIDIMMHAVMVGTGRNVMEGGVVVVLFGDNFFSFNLRSRSHLSLSFISNLILIFLSFFRS